MRIHYQQSTMLIEITQDVGLQTTAHALYRIRL